MQVINTLQAKVCLVTGASQGLGRHFSTVLAQAGATVVVTSLKAEIKALENLAAEINASGGRALAMPLDLRDVAQFTAIIEHIEQQVGSIEVLVNNAGVSYYTRFFDIEEKDWDIHVDVNLKGVFFLSQAVAKRMIAQKVAGNIINIGSIAGLQAKKYHLPFCVSKAGLHHLTKLMAYELVDHGIRVNAISPGLFPSPYVADYIASNAGNNFVQQIPMKRPGRYEELDGALLLLAADASSYMTGSVIEVDGGFAIDLFLHEDFEGDKTNAFFTPR